MRLLFVFYPLVLTFLAYECSSEVYTALVNMEKLMTAEQFLLRVLNQYITWAERNLVSLKFHFARFHSEHRDMVKKGAQQYLSNPVNAYLITKRLTTDWSVVEDLMTNKMGERILSNFKQLLYESNIPWPTDNDLRGAALALTRLQRTYNLKTPIVAEGEVNGKRGGNRLSANDCFELGRQSHLFSDHEYSELWMKEALYRYYREVNKTTNLVDILDYLSYAAYKRGDFKQALRITNKILKEDSNHQNAVINKAVYKKKVQESTSMDKTEKQGFRSERNDMLSFQEFAKLCRNEYKLSEKVKAKLRCRYVDFGEPFLMLAKLKEEEAYLNPRIVIYHDAIYDVEIETMKNLATPQFHRATVLKGDTREVVDYRIGQMAWLRDHVHPHVGAVSRRIYYMSGLNMATSEPFQVLNYGMGGHYSPHFDFSAEGEISSIIEKFGNRIATVLFYLNTVPQGGGTAFPALNLTVTPRKGTAVIWYNMFKSGVLDYRTEHGACPVLEGTKWISTKWLRERGQVFARPCETFQDEFEVD